MKVTFSVKSEKISFPPPHHNFTHSAMSHGFMFTNYMPKVQDQVLAILPPCKVTHFQLNQRRRRRGDGFTFFHEHIGFVNKLTKFELSKSFGVYVVTFCKTLPGTPLKAKLQLYWDLKERIGWEMPATQCSEIKFKWQMKQTTDQQTSGCKTSFYI